MAELNQCILDIVHQDEMRGAVTKHLYLTTLDEDRFASVAPTIRGKLSVSTFKTVHVHKQQFPVPMRIHN